MTTENEARDAIYDRWRDQWGSTTPYALGDEAYKPSETVPAWARVTVRHEDRRQTSLGGVGNRRFRTDGRIFVQVFVNRDRGDKTLDAFLTQAREVFEAQILGGVWVTSARARELGVDGKWQQGQVEAAFNYEEVK
jgi:hypothetical protein